MKTYILRVSPSGVLDVFSTEGGHRNSVPPVIDAEFCPVSHLEVITRHILSDYFGGEEDAEIKARLLTRGVARRLQRLGRGAETTTRGNRQFPITEAELNDIVCNVLLDATVTTDAVVLEIAGCRRDLLRQAALTETTSRLAN